MKPFQNLLLCSTSSLLSPPPSSSIFSLLSSPFSSSSSSSSPSSATTITANGAAVAAATSTESKPATLPQEHLTKINLLIPRLCYLNHLSEAIRLLDATLQTNPPLKSISLSILIDCLTSQPDMTQPISLLSRLKHNPNAHPHLLFINNMLISSYIKKGKPKEAYKLFNRMSRPDSPCAPDAAVYGILVRGLCRNGLVFESLRVFRAMAAANLVPRGELRERVYRCLLREARVREAKELNEALGSVGDDGGEVGLKKVVELLDQIIDNWTD